jgi:hypothetical protein
MEDDGPGQQTKHCPNLSVSRLAPVAIHPFFDSGLFCQTGDGGRQAASQTLSKSASVRTAPVAIHPFTIRDFFAKQAHICNHSNFKRLDTNIMFVSHVRNSSLERKTRCNREDIFTNDVARSNPTAASTTTDHKETSVQLEIEPKPQEMI